MAVAAATAVAVTTVAAIDVIGDATQTRPDELRPGYRSEVRFRVTHRHRTGGVDAAASALWNACRPTALRRIVEPLHGTDDGDYRVVVAPELGHHGGERMAGCLRDLTVDRVVGRDVRIRTMPPA